MYRFLLTPRWLLFHLVVIAAIVGMISLGFWQLRRLEQRKDFNDVIATRYDETPVPLDTLLERSGGDLDAIEWRPALVTGEFLPDEVVRVVNRSQGGTAGDNVVVPLLLDGGDLVLVNRGFVPLSVDDEEMAPVPSGEVTVSGRVHPSEVRRRGQISDPAQGELDTVQRIDIDRLAPQLPGPPRDVYLDQVSVEPAVAGDAPRYPEPIAPPELGEGPHLSYAVQWFIFSACVAAGWVLAVRRSAATRRHEESPTPTTL